MGYTGFSELIGYMVQSGNAMAIDLDPVAAGRTDFAVLPGVTIDSLSAGDFIFG